MISLPERGLVRVGACPVCGGTRFTPHLQAGGWALVRCGGCGLVLLAARPPAEAYDDGDLDRFLDRAILGRPEAEIEANGDRVRQLGRFTRPGALCDVGAGPGFFMKAAERAGWVASGCDPVSECAAFGREHLGLQGLRVGTFATAFTGLPRPLEAVTLFHTLEHMVDPLRELRRAWALLRPGGVVAVEVPDIGSAEARATGPAWEHLRLPFHLYFFTPDALTRLLTRAGFRTLEVGPRTPAWFLRVFAQKTETGQAGAGSAPHARPGR